MAKSNRRAIQKLANMVRANMGVRRVHRIRMLDQTITQGTSTPFALLTCNDDPNYDLATDGTNVAECQVGARIVAVQLHLSLTNIPNGETVEWILGRDPDASITTAGFLVGNVYTADVTTGNRLLKDNTWTIGHVMAGTASRDTFNGTLRIPGKTMRRSRLMNENDVIRLVFTHTAAGSSSLMYLRGRIVTRGP